MNNYTRFSLMIASSTAVMFGLTYLNTYSADHIFFSETRFYMAFVMGAAMSIVMLSFMLGMHKNTKANIAIFAASALVFVLALFLVRSQTTIGDTSYMRAMIPHHSIAVLTSERAGIKDSRVRKLADGIIRAQRKEIKEMKWLISDIQQNGLAKTEQDAQQRPVPTFKGELSE